MSKKAYSAFMRIWTNDAESGDFQIVENIIKNSAKKIQEKNTLIRRNKRKVGIYEPLIKDIGKQLPDGALKKRTLSIINDMEKKTWPS